MKLPFNYRVVLIYLSGVIATLIGGPLGAPILKAFFRQYGALSYWLLFLPAFATLSSSSVLLSAYYIALVATIGIFCHLEKRGVTFWWAALTSCLVPGILWVLLLYGRNGFHLAETQNYLEIHLNGFIENLKEMGNKAEAFDAKTMIRLFPAILISSFIIFLGTAICLERRSFQLFGLKYERYASQLQNLEFRLPEWAIWPTLMSMLFSLIATDMVIKGIGQNILTLMSVLYFFQGLAILEVVLLVTRAGFLMRFFAYFAFVTNLVLVLSAIGFADYWLDFRRRLRVKSPKVQ